MANGGKWRVFENEWKKRIWMTDFVIIFAWWLVYYIMNVLKRDSFAVISPILNLTDYYFLAES